MILPRGEVQAGGDGDWSLSGALEGSHTLNVLGFAPRTGIQGRKDNM